MIKKILSPILVLTTMLVSPVFANTDSDSSIRTITPLNVKTPIKKIVIYGNADIMLISDGSTEITIDENTVGMDGIRFAYENNHLEIITREYNTAKKPVIRIPAQQLEKLEINGDAKVYSESIIRSVKLDVFINGACDLNIRSTGKIIVKASADYHLNYFKDERIKIKPGLN